MAHLLHLEEAPINSAAIAGQWPSVNVTVDDNRVQRRWDWKLNRELEDGQNIQSIPIYSKFDGTQLTFVLTDTDLCEIVDGTDETYTYRTNSHTAGKITDIEETVLGSGNFNKVTGDANCNFDISGLNSGDKFILDEDFDPKKEHSQHWATIATVDSATQLTLEDHYTGTLVDGGNSAYRVRKVYDTPSGERWAWCVVNGRFIFTNGALGSYAQYWEPGMGFAQDLNTTYIREARYCLGYLNRAWFADLYDNDISNRNPWLLRCSKFRDASDYVDSTSVDYTFYDSSEPLMGLGVVDGNLVVYKKTEYHIGIPTGNPTDPVSFQNRYKGPGLYAPHSLVHYLSTTAWIGAEDFYTMNGNVAVSIGGSIRKKFFDVVDPDNISRAVGIVHPRHNELLWLVNSAESPTGQYVFAWNYKKNSWGVYEFSGNMLSGFGGFGW